MRKKETINVIKEGGLTHVHTEMSRDAIMAFDEIGDYVKNNLSSDYFTVGDHLTSPYKERKYSVEEIRGVVEEMLKKVSQYNETHEKPKCISGVEANIVMDGVDIPDALLERIDFVIASRHFPWGNDGPEEIVKKLILAMEDEHVDTIGHVNRHVDIPIDWDAIFKVAERTHTFIEINFDTPPPIDLLRIMSRYKLFYTIGVDFHTFQGLKQRIPIHSQVVADITEAKKMIKEKTEQSTELKKEYLQEPVGYAILKKLVTTMRLLEVAGISPQSIINTCNYNEFIELLKKPKNQRMQ